MQFPTPFPVFPLSVPLEVQATSYLAASDKIFNFSINESFSGIRTCISRSSFRKANICSEHLFYCITEKRPIQEQNITKISKYGYCTGEVRRNRPFAISISRVRTVHVHTVCFDRTLP